eukprot:7281530-Ditylum_brightwellii.AAC.1
MYKFGMQVPRTGDVGGAMKLDKENGNNFCFDAQKKEASTLRDMATFDSFSIETICIEYKHMYIRVLWYIIYDNDQRWQARQMAKWCTESPTWQTASSIGPSD